MMDEQKSWVEGMGNLIGQSGKVRSGGKAEMPWNIYQVVV